jgi:hypothetical protein
MVGCNLSVAVISNASLLIEQASPSVELALNGEPIRELVVARWDGRGLWSSGVNGGCHCLFVEDFVGLCKDLF